MTKPKVTAVSGKPKKKAAMDQELDLKGPTAQALINKMTNWQRSQWQRSKRPCTMRALILYTKLDHWKKGKRVQYEPNANP